MLLLMLLPLQAIWAAAEPYCGHEHGKAAHHVGHHLHEHHDDGASHGGDGDGGSKASSMVDHDHHCCASLSLLPSVWAMPAVLPSSDLATTTQLRYAQVPISHIDRPQWPSSL